MRWSRLFADLEGQWNAHDRQARHMETAERIRSERADIDLSSRLWAARRETLTLTLTNGDHVSGMLEDAAHTWLLLATQGRNVLVPTHAIAMVSGSGSRADTDAPLVRKLSWGYAMRALSRDRCVVQVVTAAGSAHGLIGAVGEDYCEVIDPARQDRITLVSAATIVYVAGPW